MPVARNIFGTRLNSRTHRQVDQYIPTDGTPFTTAGIAQQSGEVHGVVSARILRIYQRGFLVRHRTGREFLYAYNTNRTTSTSSVTTPVRTSQVGRRPFGLELEFLAPVSINRNMAATAGHIVEALRTEGIDCAWEGYDHRTPRAWKLVYDVSCRTPGFHGLEIVSPILRESEETDRTIETICRVLTEMGCEVNRRTGVHVHHAGIGFEDLATRHAFHRFYGEAEHLLDSIMPPSRREGNTFCMQVRGTVPGGTRYRKLNTEFAYNRHRTIEFRHHSGSLEASKILPWIRLTRAMMENNFREVQTHTLEGFLDGFNVSEADRRYFLGRRDHFANGGTRRRTRRTATAAV